MEKIAKERKNVFQRILLKIKDNRRKRKEADEAYLMSFNEYDRENEIKRRKKMKWTVIGAAIGFVVVVLFFVFFREIMIFIALGIMCLGEMFGGKRLPD